MEDLIQCNLLLCTPYAVTELIKHLTKAVVKGHSRSDSIEQLKSGGISYGI